MSDMSLESSKPEEFDTLVADIEQSHKEPGTSDIHESILKRCIQYLRSNHVGRHWYCDPYMFPVSTHVLILFSFPNQNFLSELKPYMAESLSKCTECVKKFSLSKSILRENFAITKGIPITNVNHFLKLITDWEAANISQVLKSYIDEQINSTLSTESTKSVPVSVKSALMECLNVPIILRSHANIREFYKTVTNYLSSKNQVLFDPKEILPGIIYLIFEGTSDQKFWAEKCLKELANSGFKLNKNTLTSPIIEEFSVHFYRVQDAKYFTEHVSTKFWSVLLLLFDIVDDESFIDRLNSPKDLQAMSEFTNIRLYPVLRVFFNNIMSFIKEPFPVLLKLLNQFLCRFKANFWLYCVPFTYVNVLDVVSNPEFGRLLLLLPESDDKGLSIKDITQWIPSLMTTLSEAQQQTASIRLGTFLLKHNAAHKTKDTPSNPVDRSKLDTLDLIAFDILLQSFKIGNQSNDFRNKNYSVNLLRRREVRAILEYNADTVVDLAVTSDLSPCIKLISEALEYDLALLAHNTSVLLQNSEPASYDSFPSLWQSLAKKPIYSHKKLTTEILRVLKNTCCSIEFVTKKSEENGAVGANKKLVEAKKSHNSNVSLIFKLLATLLEKISLADPSLIRDIFISVNGSIAIWSCVFSPLVNQAALDILYQVFDIGIGGRLEAIQELLSNHLKPTLVAVNENLQNLILMEAFEPCPKAIRLLMDIINGLCDPLTGVLSSNSSSNFGDCIPQIQLLWSRCWAFLVMVYQKTLVWANWYHLDDLIEFTRDTLDLSHILLNSFRSIIDKIDPSKETVDQLFTSFMDAFKSVVVWLRLGDMSLLNSCVELVFNGFDLAKELKFPVDSQFLETFVKYGTKAKKFNNKLTENQRSQILSKARDFDDDLVDRIVLETQQQRSKRKSKEVIDLSEEYDSASTPEPAGATYKYQTHVKPPKQQTLSRYGVVTSAPPVAPAPKDIKSSSLDSIRKDLKNSRAPSLKPAGPVIAPAAPRPAGFNSRRPNAPPAVGRSLNSLKKKSAVDSDSSEDEENVDFSDLFVDKKKKPKVTEVDIHGRPIPSGVSRQNKIDLARKAEENMRARLNVSLKPLYNTILRWNYNSNDAYPFGDKDTYQPIQNSYSNVKEYVKITEPLLMLECWQGIQSAKQTGQEEPFELLVGSRTSVDGFFDVYASCRKSVLADRKIGDSDLLVLGFASVEECNGTSGDIRAYLKGQNSRTCLAKVREIKSANSEFSDITLRVYPSGSMMGVLTPKSSIVAMKVMQMITVEREFSSLKGLQYYDLSDAIINAKPNDPVKISDEDANNMRRLYDVNKSQAMAIMGSYNSEGFSLIQGPPGTGKTKTILGVVGYSLSQQMKEGVIEVPGESSGPTSGEKKGKILICAPSNAAVDELVLRLRNGVRNSKGEQMPLSVVRLGRSDAINASVRDLTLEELVDKELQSRISMDTSTDPNIRVAHTNCIAERNKIREQLNAGDLSADEQTALETKLREVNMKRNELAKKLDEQRERVSIAYRTKEIEKRNIQAKILTNAQVICATLSGSAHDFLAKLSVNFDQVIIDEACQCVELSAIIPLRYGCKKCIMVGDPNQLPPTVLSQTAASLNYEQSLFVRMQKNNPDSVYLLDVQYRMHPDISQFPSSEFYHSRLKDGPDTRVLNERPWHQSFPLTPYRFFDIVSSHQRNEISRSLFNAGEARVALEIVEKLMKIFPENEFSGRVGIISPYKAQINTLKDIFVRKYGKMILSEIDFNTVDGFQGQEKEIIIMSCVRASETGNVGFLSDIRRMNVALTRAKTSLWILGNLESLSRNAVWKRLLQNASERDCVTKAGPGFLNSIQINNTMPSKRLNNSPPNHELKRFKPEPQEPKNYNTKENQAIKEETKSRSIKEEPNFSNELPKKPNIKPESGKVQPIKSSVFSSDSSNQAPRPVKKNMPTVYKSPTTTGAVPNPNGPRPSSSGAIQPPSKKPIKPTSSGTIRKNPSSIFINSRKPPKRQ